MFRGVLRDQRANPAFLAIGGCLLLGIAQYFLFRINFSQFFQGDAIFWMYYRFHTFGEFLRGLVALDVAHWYRPLSNRTIPSLLFPLFGLRPYGYHLVVFGFFFLTSCVLFHFVKRLTGAVQVAFLAAFYFSVHSNNVYTTFDFAFMPDVLYGLFYICAVWFFMEWERRRRHLWYACSAACFVLSLMSKEAAVTLPAVLVLFHLIFIRGNIIDALRKIWLHLVVFSIYATYVAGYLGVGGGDYMLVPHRNVLTNFTTAVYWAFNLRRAGLTPTRVAPESIVVFLVIFAAVQLIIAISLLFRSERKVIVFGMSWFVAGLSPMLMLSAIGPYYLFLPMAGLSLVIGTTLGKTYESLSARSRMVAGPAIGSILLLIWLSCRIVIPADMANDVALGYAARWASNSATDILRAYPRPPSGTKVYILNDSFPDLWRYHGLGNLFKLVYNDNTITTSYRSLGASPRSGENSPPLVMKAEAGHLVDVTSAFRQDPRRFLPAPDESSFESEVQPGMVLRIHPPEAIAGRDFYWLSVVGIEGQDVTVQYTINRGPVAEATFRLDPSGRIRFFVSDLTPPGLYEFFRFRPASGPPSRWFKSDASLRVINRSVR